MKSGEFSTRVLSSSQRVSRKFTIIPQVSLLLVPRLLLFLILFQFPLSSLGQIQEPLSALVNRLGILRAQALDRIFYKVRPFWEALDPFGLEFVDFRDPLEAISLITLYLPGVLFMLATIFVCIPHVLNFFIFLPKMWFFGLPCLYEFNQSWFKRRRRRKRQSFDAVDNMTTMMGPCDAVNLAHITRQVYSSLVKMTNTTN